MDGKERRGVLAFSVAECRDANLCLVHRGDASEGTERKTNAGKHLFFHFSPLCYTQAHTDLRLSSKAVRHLRDGNFNILL